jgi:RimJ/RimL family protein N-acetyltransferase
MIFGERIRLRADERSDIPFFQNWLNDPEVLAGLGHYLPFSLVAEEQWFESMIKQPREEQPLAIEALPASGVPDDAWQLIGNCGLFGFEWKNRLAELGIFIGEKAYWNHGYGAEAMRLLLRHGFDTLNLNRIWLRVFCTNQRAIRCYEKVGFVHEGCYRQAEFRNGEYIDVLIMSVLRSEWKG